MRFVISGEWTRNSLLRLIVIFFLIYITVFTVTSALLYFDKMGLTYTSVVEYYRGSEERFQQPRSYRGLLEVSHMHLFAMGTLILTLTHLLLFVPLTPTTKARLIVASFTSAFLDEASSWLIRFVSPSFAYLKIVSFVALELSLLAVIALVFHALLTYRPSAYMDTDEKRKPA
jgi:hypothetical protein